MYSNLQYIQVSPGLAYITILINVKTAAVKINKQVLKTTQMTYTIKY